MISAASSMHDEQALEYVARYGEREFRYHLCYLPEQKTPSIKIHVHPNGMVQVDAPKTAQMTDIKAAVQRRARWILKHLDEIAERHRHLLPRQWVSGESMLYLGRRYVLKIIEDNRLQKDSCKLIAGQLRVEGRNLNAQRIQKITRQWYRERALDVFQKRMTLIVEVLPWTKDIPDWRLVDMQTQWGSCSPKGVVLLNPNLIKATTRAIDYVILHELCHLEEHNHSQRFYGLLDRYMPDWQSVKEQLDGRADLIME